MFAQLRVEAGGAGELRLDYRDVRRHDEREAGRMPTFPGVIWPGVVGVVDL